jgi:hypothetical protein
MTILLTSYLPTRVDFYSPSQMPATQAFARRIVKKNSVNNEMAGFLIWLNLAQYASLVRRRNVSLSATHKLLLVKDFYPNE